MGPCDRCELVVGHVGSAKRGGEIVEVPDHRGREVEVQFSARDVANLEPMLYAKRDEDERACGAPNLLAVKVHDVLAFENVKDFRRVAVNVDRRPESRRLGCLENRHHSASACGVCLHHHLELAQVDQPSLPGHQCERAAIFCHRLRFSLGAVRINKAAASSRRRLSQP